MITKTMLGIFLAIGLSTIPAFAENMDILSPYKQFQNGTPINEIQCRDGKILMETSRGTPACVNENSVEKLENIGFILVDVVRLEANTIDSESNTVNTETNIIDSESNTVNTETNIIDEEQNIDTSKNIPTRDSINFDDAELMAILEKELVFTSKDMESNKSIQLSELHSFGGHPIEIWPIYNVTYPSTAKVGVPFDVVYEYSFVIPDEETGDYVNFNEQCSENDCGQMQFFAKVSSYVNVTSDNLKYDRDLIDGKTIPMINSTVYEYHPEFDNTQSLEEIFTFVINEPDIDYRIGKIQVQMQLSHNDDVVYFYVDDSGNVIFDPMMEKETFDQSSFAKSDAPSVRNTASAIQTELDKLQERPPAWTQNVVTPPTGLRDGVPPELYGYLSEKLLRDYPGENYEEFFRYHNYTQSWIDDFLNAMPHLRSDDSLTSQTMDFLTSYMLLPPAYGAEATTSIFGKLVNTDEDGSSVFVHGGTVCAYDATSSGLNPIIINNEYVCSETVQSGTFVFDIPTADPNGSGNTDLVLKAFAKNDHFEFFLNNTEVIIDDDTQFNIILTVTQDIGNFDISEQVYLSVPIEHQHFWALDRLTDIQEWYTDNVVANTEKIFVIYDPTICSSGADYDPDTSKMFLSHTSKSDGSACTSNIHSPLTNKDTLAHEYGHVVFYQTYDNYSSEYPTVDITDPSGYHSPVHSNSDGTAWVEGWAFFMATAYSGSSTYQPSYMAGQWNFETRTHNEVIDSDFAGKSFVTGNSGEGNVAAALWDALDTVNESGDDQQNLLDEIWDTLGDFVESDETVIATDISQYKDDWDDDGNPSLNSIFNHNTLVYATAPPPSSDGIFFIEDFEGDLTKWTLSNGNSALVKQWEITTPNRQISGYPSANMVAVTDNDCDDSCIMTLETSLDLSSLGDAKLLIDRWVDRSLDSGNTPKEGLKVEVSSDGGSTWESAYEWTADAGHDIDEWFLGDNDSDAYTIPESKLSSNFKIKIIGTSSASSETIYIDNIKITSSSVAPPDTVLPVITLLPPTDMTIQVNTAYIDPGYSASDDIDIDISSDVAVLGSVDVTTLGTYTITYNVSDSSNNSAIQKTRTVNVVDTIPPTFNSVPENQTFEATGSLTVLSSSQIGTAAATDLYDSNPTITNNATLSFPLGDTVITWTATDDSNNSSTDTQTITIQDTTAPALDLPLNNLAFMFASDHSRVVSFDTPAFSDTVDDSVVVTCDPASGSVFDVGSTVVNCTGIDFSGNSASASFTVLVSQQSVPPLPVNLPPVAFDDSEITLQNTLVNIAVLDNDSDSEPLTLLSVGNATNGTVDHVGSIVTYTPDTDFVGLDSFNYTVSDGILTDMGSVSITVHEGTISDFASYQAYDYFVSFWNADVCTLGVSVNSAPYNLVNVSVSSPYEHHDTFSSDATYKYRLVCVDGDMTKIAYSDTMSLSDMPTDSVTSFGDLDFGSLANGALSDPATLTFTNNGTTAVKLYLLSTGWVDSTGRVLVSNSNYKYSTDALTPFDSMTAFSSDFEFVDWILPGESLPVHIRIFIDLIDSDFHGSLTSSVTSSIDPDDSSQIILDDSNSLFGSLNIEP